MPRALLSFAVFAAVVAAQAPAADADLESFETVWSTIRDTHWQKENPGGLDWRAIHDEFRPRIESAQSPEAARALINEMLGRLGEPSFAVFSSQAPLAALPALGQASPGFEVRLFAGRAIVTRVSQGSPAARGGVKIGWELVTAGAIDFRVFIHSLMSDPALTDLQRELSLAASLTGAAGEKRMFVFKGRFKLHKERNLTLVREAALVQARRIGSHHRVAYLRVEMDQDMPRVLTEFTNAIQSVGGSEALVIDLRGNPAGKAGAGVAMGIAGWLVEQPGQRLGTLYQRNATIALAVYPRAKAFSGPVALLVDELSSPAAAMLASGLQDLGRARVFGVQTAPIGPAVQIRDLSNGDRLEYAVENYVSAHGEALPNGVVPDEQVSISRRRLSTRHDAVIDAAVKWAVRSIHTTP